MRFNLLIKGGTVLDPGAGFSGALDVAINGGVIEAVDKDIPAEAAHEVVDAAGLLVTPGLIDLHAHIYPGATYWGIRPDPVAARTGVTAWVDAGSVGAMNVLGLREYLDRTSRVHAYAFLNISYIGLTSETEELTNLSFCSVEHCVKLARLNADFVRGVKVRMAAQTVGPNGIEPLLRGLKVADALDLPLMMHIGSGPPAIDEVIALLRPGDLVTHALSAHSMKLVGDDGKPKDAVRRALDRGVLLDMGHGAGGFAFEAAEALAASGVLPHVVSTDLHQRSLWGPVWDLPTCMAKAMSLGMSLSDVVAATTSVPAKVLGLAGKIGTLHPGAPADVALFRTEEGQFELTDTRKVSRTVPMRLVNTKTYVAGRSLQLEEPNQPAPWI